MLHNGDTPNFFKAALSHDDPIYSKRPSSAQNRFLDAQEMMIFKDEDMVDDRFARYKNDKWPFIISVQRYSQPTRQGARGDTAYIEIPKDAEVGDYVAWYHWRGYRDAIE